ncbi:MAG: hypothetical protein VKK04_03370 [Synechococcales bacterium]|nr:hypothetical protein [Synechococcales bacterium]
MMQYATLLLLGGAIACTSQPLVSSPPPPPEQPSPPSSTLISIMTPSTHPPMPYPRIAEVSLIARVEPLPPLGVEAPVDHPTGFADIFLVVENPGNQNAQIVVRRVAILSDRHQEIPFPEADSELPRAIALKPMENAVIDLHRSSTGGYGQTTMVRASVVYEVEGIAYQIESPRVEVR